MWNRPPLPHGSTIEMNRRQRNACTMAGSYIAHTPMRSICPTIIELSLSCIMCASRIDPYKLGIKLHAASTTGNTDSLHNQRQTIALTRLFPSSAVSSPSDLATDLVRLAAFTHHCCSSHTKLNHTDHSPEIVSEARANALLELASPIGQLCTHLSIRHAEHPQNCPEISQLNFFYASWPSTGADP